MPALKPVHYRKLVDIFEREGFVFVRQSGDHLIYTKSGIKRLVMIPMCNPVPVTVS